MDIAQRIRKMRHDLDMSQTEFATFVGTRQPVISRWETGAQTPSPGYRRVIELLEPVAQDMAKKREPYREQ